MSRLGGLITAAKAYAATRFRQMTWRSRSDIQRHQRKLLGTFMSGVIQRVEVYKNIPRGAPLETLPYTDKSALMAAFDRFNTPRLTAELGWQAFASTKTFDNNIVGASTGTSGNRGLFIISQEERFRWLGTLLAKALPGFWYRRERVAVILPLNTPLYDSANETGLLKLKFFDITAGLETWQQSLLDFAPTVIVSPPKLLRALAPQAVNLRPQKLFAAAETLDLVDKTIIETAFNLKLGQIYMATEGLLAVSCKDGNLHLCEDVMHFELEPVGDGLVSPVITDFSRITQIMARYRMNDLLRLSTTPCPCGSPLLRVAEVVGRNDDCFSLPKQDGSTVLVTPDILRNVVLDSNRTIEDFRIWQTGYNEVVLVLPHDLRPDIAQQALAALQNLLTEQQAAAHVTLAQEVLVAPQEHKLRRVENKFKGALA